MCRVVRGLLRGAHGTVARHFVQQAALVVALALLRGCLVHVLDRGFARLVVVIGLSAASGAVLLGKALVDVGHVWGE